MDEIRELVWNGGLNLQISLHPSAMVVNHLKDPIITNIRVPRDCYIVFYMKVILKRFRNYLNLNINESNKDCFFWFEYENVPLYWNFPIGALYDTMTNIMPNDREEILLDRNDHLNIWKLELHCGTKIPNGLIPIIDEEEQIRRYWMHQWKQACYILNGSSKKVMSFSMKDWQKFWDSVKKRNLSDFNDLAMKVRPSHPRNVPVIIHLNYPNLQKKLPFIKIDHDADNGHPTVFNVLNSEYPEIFKSKNSSEVQCVCNGVIIPLEILIFELYKRFLNFDGFLHLSICFSSNNNQFN
ncbi:hypothetical protein TPHA_0D01200 [Tetrapisispora phaffii CBS 4417]|uniref:Autophagy protein 5 n=1 Tax=Tetrapisispora phaffii (strain ATCC 24235 / CBS 4417 / NBRC 1672 / NRRL Y-8282 / UCD 70-5) TaxID=1071381 RepID=G8BSE0_TETPH|nr:hypothetical protein TPHA_0D01200 [Tetrapisispora phaffii CBS 4417]CCE62761.1 hypothetical protein TPHA_0D01200 [Tetrapisispora phaffii CBS 4417]